MTRMSGMDVTRTGLQVEKNYEMAENAGETTETLAK